MFSNLKEVYKAGRKRSYEFGKLAVAEINMGDEVSVLTMFTNETFNIETDEDLEEMRIAEAFGCEQNNRQMSPFEFTACDLNQYGSGDAWDYAAAWEAFDNGIYAGIKCALRCHK